MTEPESELIRQFISDHVDGLPVADDEDLFASGYVDSLFAVQLVMWVERTFHVPVERGDLDFANFQTISAIVSFVDHKRKPVALANQASVGGRSWTSD